jgi:4-hydroxybenzoyl-CoA reductase subunit alpha
VAEVEVDTDTGEVRVLHIWIAHDCGRAINPLAVEGQVQGAVWMGLGQALSEQNEYHEGLPLRPNFIDYRMVDPVSAPPIEVTLVESIDPLGPFGAKEASEGGLHATPPAVAAAIHDALGLRLQALPMTPEHVLEAVHKQRRAERQARAVAARKGTPATASGS